MFFFITSVNPQTYEFDTARLVFSVALFAVGGFFTLKGLRKNKEN